MPINEVLYSYAPGMWTYRDGGVPLKARAYQSLREVSNNTWSMPLWGVDGDEHGHHMFVEESSVDPDQRPWSTPLLGHADEIKIARPVKIILIPSRGDQGGNKVVLHPTSEGLVNDNDDIERSSTSAARRTAKTTKRTSATCRHAIRSNGAMSARCSPRRLGPTPGPSRLTTS